MKKRITHVPKHSFIIILNYQNQFIRILIYQNQSEKKIKKKKREYPCEFWWTYQTGYKSAYFPNLGRLVPEFGELEYFVKYPTPPNSGTILHT